MKIGKKQLKMDISSTNNKHLLTYTLLRAMGLFLMFDFLLLKKEQN